MRKYCDVSMYANVIAMRYLPHRRCSPEAIRPIYTCRELAELHLDVRAASLLTCECYGAD